MPRPPRVLPPPLSWMNRTTGAPALASENVRDAQPCDVYPTERHQTEEHSGKIPDMNRHEQQLAHLGWRRADPPRQPVLFVNPASGGGKAVRAELAKHARERGIEVSVVGPDRTLAMLVREADVELGADALGVAGGDGSLAVVAAAAQQHGVPLVCVPAGTLRNPLRARPGRRPERPGRGGIEAFTDGVERLIDMGSVNGRLFLNNVSLGIYGEAVRQSAYRGAKARTLFETAREVLGPSAAAPELRLVDDQGREHRNPAVVLVSNNRYALDRPLAQGTRPRLDSGRLEVIVLDAPGSSRTPGRGWTATSLKAHGPAPVHAGIDGEAIDLGHRSTSRSCPPRCESGSSRHRSVSHRACLP